MIAIGIDIGKGKHAFAAIDGNGREILKPAFVTNDLDGLERMLEAIGKLAPCEDAVIGMEATGAYWCNAYDFLARAGYRVDVINPIVSAASIAGDIRGRKSDKTDALVIARIVLAGRTRERADAGVDARRLATLTRYRTQLVHMRVEAKLHLESVLDRCFPEIRRLFPDLFGSCAMAVLAQYPTARALSRAHRDALARIIKGHTRGKSDDDVDKMADGLVAAAKRSLAVASDTHEVAGFCVRRLIGTIGHFDEEIAEVEAEMEKLEAPRLAKLLAPIKGMGKLLPMVIAAELGDLSRFEKDPKSGKRRHMWKRVLAFIGAEPRLWESGISRGVVHMSKRGNAGLRTAFFQAAFSVSRYDPYFKAVYDRQKARGKHHFVALSYVIAELVLVMCALWKQDRPYSAVQTIVSKDAEMEAV